MTDDTAADTPTADSAIADTPTADPSSAGAPAAGGVESPSGGEIGYTAALAELGEILHELDGDEVDVDVLGGRVRRAAELLRICRGRIASARFEVEQVVAELDSTALPPEPDADVDALEGDAGT